MSCYRNVHHIKDALQQTNRRHKGFLFLLINFQSRRTDRFITLCQRDHRYLHVSHSQTSSFTY